MNTITSLPDLNGLGREKLAHSMHVIEDLGSSICIMLVFQYVSEILRKKFKQAIKQMNSTTRNETKVMLSLSAHQCHLSL